MTKPATQVDAVDRILAQWREQRPDLDVAPMAAIGRLKRCAALVQRKLDETFERYGLSAWEFDVLATLRRSGAPYCLAPTALFSALMVSSGTMTHRMRGLESRALVQRLPNPDDARSVLVQLTPQGLALIDAAVPAHVENERRLLAGLSAKQLAALEQSLADLLALWEPEGLHAHQR